MNSAVSCGTHFFDYVLQPPPDYYFTQFYFILFFTRKKQMTGILYTAFASENQEQKIAHIYVTVQHCRLETETIEKTAQFAHEAYFPLAEFKVSQKSIQSRKQWIKFCRLLVLVPGCCTDKPTGCILGCWHLWSSEPVSSFLPQDRRPNTPSGWLNTERADAERHTDLMGTLLYRTWKLPQ